VLGVVFASTVIGGLAVGCGGAEDGRGAREADLEPAVGANIPVATGDGGIEGVAAGEGAVWVGTAAGCEGSVERIDPERNRVVATIPIAIVYDLAAGSGAIWAAGEVCRGGPMLWRINPASNEVEATIPLGPHTGARSSEASVSGVAVGQGGVWVSLSYEPRTGEVVRIDPRNNELVARISTQGYAGELAAGAGAVWVLGHPEYTDETEQGELLHRIDPGTNELVATPLRDERLVLGGYFFPPVIVAEGDAVWVNSSGAAYPHGALAIRIDAHTNRVTRKPLPNDHFFPFAVTGGRVWFTSPDGDLSHLDPRNLEVKESLKLGVNVGDAAFDSATRSFWIAAVAVGRGDQGAVLRVDLH
jgi:hypothetical protein